MGCFFSFLGQDAGSFLKALYTMFEVTHSGSWPAVVRPVIEKVSPWYDARRRQAYKWGERWVGHGFEIIGAQRDGTSSIWSVLNIHFWGLSI